MLVVKNLAYKRNEQFLFKNVGFTLVPGTALQIIGPNGIGKSTLLRVLAGLSKPSGGIISSTKPICYIGHQHNLHPVLTVLQNLRFLQEFIDYPSQNSSANLQAGIEYFNLQRNINTKCSELSAGQQQRVSLARLYGGAANIWLLDEPLANLDVSATDLLQQLLTTHLTAGGCVITATHKLLDFTPQTAAILKLEEYV